MKFASLVSVIALFSASAVAQLTKVTWNNFYDNANQSLSTVACAEWAAKNNFNTFGDLKAFPFIGGASVVNGPNSPNCGTCYSITDEQTGVTIDVLVVDAAGDGFVISLDALNVATKGNAMNLGSIQANVTQVSDTSKCNSH